MPLAPSEYAMDLAFQQDLPESIDRTDAGLGGAVTDDHADLRACEVDLAARPHEALSSEIVDGGSDDDD